MSIQFDFSGRGVFVTDSAAGLNRHVAAAFHALGASVAVHDRSPAVAEQAVRELGGGARLVAAGGDLTTPANVPGIVEGALTRLGRLDVLVCGSDKAHLRGIDELSEADFSAMLSGNTKQAFFTAQACVPALRETRGAIVHIASTIGLIGGPKGAVGLATASGATVQMARMMALELAPDGIRVNALCPAWVNAQSPSDAQVLADFLARRAPGGRLATAEECTAAVLYLAASFAGATTGATLITDGGIASGHYIG